MGWILLIAFVGVPLVEIAVFIQVGGWLGLVPTLIIVIATAVIGTALLRRQGLTTLARARDNMDRGVLPMVEIFDGVCLLLAGALLLTPGFVTDALGAVLLMPPARQYLRRRLAARFVEESNVSANDPSGAIDGAIDGEFHEIDAAEGTERPTWDKKSPEA